MCKKLSMNTLSVRLLSWRLLNMRHPTSENRLCILTPQPEAQDLTSKCDYLFCLSCGFL